MPSQLDQCNRQERASALCLRSEHLKLLPDRCATAKMAPGARTGLCGILLLALAGLLAFGSPKLAGYIAWRMEDAIREQLVWQPDSPAAVQARYSGDFDPPLYASFRFFNISNVAEVRKGAKPVLQEVGPYVFAKARRRRSVEWLAGGASVSYHNYEYHVFVPEMSNGSMDDPITTLNVPLVGALENIEARAGTRLKAILELLAGFVERWGDRSVQGIFTTRPVGELLWGYEDALLAQLARWVPGITVDPWFKLVGNMSSPEAADAAFPFQANTGLQGLSSVWQTEVWENVTEVHCWGEGHVERVRGTDAFQFRPGLKLNDSVEAWVPPLFRAARMIAKEQISFLGVPVLRLRPDMTQADPDPRFFQTIKGLMNISTPIAVGPRGTPGAPGPGIFLAYPHFCGADPSLAQGVEGLHCRPEYLDLYLDVEPSTGVTLRAAQRMMMVSWFGQRYAALDPAVPDSTFLPIFWTEMTSEAGPEQMKQFTPLLRARLAERVLRVYARPAAAGLAAAGFAALCVVAVLWNGGSRADEQTAEGGGYERLEAGEQPAIGEANGEAAYPQAEAQQKPREPVSFPVAVDGAQDGRDGAGS